MNWIGFNFFKKNTYKYYHQDIYLKFIKKIIESSENSTFEISHSLNKEILSQFDASCTVGLKKLNKKEDVNSYIEIIENTHMPNLVRDSTPLRSLIKMTGKKDFNFHSFLFNNIKPINNNFPYDPSNDRWGHLEKKYKLTIRDYHYPGDCILFILQLHTDQSLYSLYNGKNTYLSFCINSINKLLQISDRSIIVRSHPIYRDNPKFDIITPSLNKYFKNNKRIMFSNNRDLEDDFNVSRCVISYNSNTTVEALLFGLNVINLSPANPCISAASNNLNDVENLKEISRAEFFRKIAFLHWESEELSSIENKKYLSQLLNSKASNIH